jgi:hypothetical protein
MFFLRRFTSRRYMPSWVLALLGLLPALWKGIDAWSNIDFLVGRDWGVLVGVVLDALAWPWLSPLLFAAAFLWLLWTDRTRATALEAGTDMNALLRKAYRDAKRRPASDRSTVLAACITGGDALVRRIQASGRQVPAADYATWVEGVEDALATEQLYGRLTALDLAEFKAAQIPTRKSTGAYTAEVWNQLNEITAKMEALQAIGRREERPSKTAD